MDVLVHVVNAIELVEEAGTDQNTGPLIAFCESCGLAAEAVTELVEMPGPTDRGKVAAALARLERPVPVEPSATEEAEADRPKPSRKKK